MPPILSICLSGRNDNYGYDFKRRFIRAMDFLAWSADRAGVPDKIEVVFTDWDSEVPLSKDIALTEKAAAMVRFIEVPPEIAKQMNHDTDVPPCLPGFLSGSGAPPGKS